ncbi:MAG: HAMP domain-containing sensor histidine kinase [Prochlorothrix sp.]|nr:HAMP domain-containing sensor histidine kinase [Prochlorothrix sp.]
MQTSLATEEGTPSLQRPGIDRGRHLDRLSQREWSSAVVALGELLRDTQEQCTPVPQSLNPAPRQATSQAAIDPESQTQPQRGLVLCGPLPVFNQPDLLTQLATWIFVPDLLASWLSPTRSLLPCGADLADLTSPWADNAPPPGCPLPPQLLPLSRQDPLNREQFCLVLTPEFSLVLVLNQASEDPTQAAMASPRGFQFSFDPDCVAQCARVLQQRAAQAYPHQAQTLAHWLERFPPIAPDYHLVSRFSRTLLQTLSHLNDTDEAPVADDRSQGDPLHPDRIRDNHLHPDRFPPVAPVFAATSDSLSDSLESSTGEIQDIQLLQALAHEVRTPLATIRTMTRLLLRRKDLAPEVLKRLDVIDHECTEQIDRFNLIFRAAEMAAEPKTQPPLRSQHLAATALDQVFRASVPRWKKQAERRSLTLAVVLPPQMPLVVSDPTMLEQALTGLMERFTRHLPTGSHIEVLVSLAGEQLKLQLRADKSNVRSGRSAFPPLANADRLEGEGVGGEGTQPQFQSLGHLLMLQPETGSVSLNLKVTKNLFQALGGKLKVREKSHQGEVLTVFLPLEVRQ